jgi:DnaJ-class molecular chaperone
MNRKDKKKTTIPIIKSVAELKRLKLTEKEYLDMAWAQRLEAKKLYMCPRCRGAGTFTLEGDGFSVSECCGACGAKGKLTPKDWQGWCRGAYHDKTRWVFTEDYAGDVPGWKIARLNAAAAAAATAKAEKELRETRLAACGSPVRVKQDAS